MRELEFGRRGKRPMILDPLQAMGLTLYPGWRRLLPAEKRDLIMPRLPQMLAEHFPEGVDIRMFRKLKEMAARDLVHMVSTPTFAQFSRQAEYAPSISLYGEDGHRSNVVYEMKICITGLRPSSRVRVNGGSFILTTCSLG